MLDEGCLGCGSGGLLGMFAWGPGKAGLWGILNGISHGRLGGER